MKLIGILIETITQAFFDKVKTPEEAKTLYRELAKKYHPDRGGNDEIMQAINNQYQDFIKHHKSDEPVDDKAAAYFRAGAAADKKWAERKAQKEKEYRNRQ